ncbi:MAG: CoA-binding protein [Chloroflexi bacterium]|nr:CoA-binding protein [Chloroflexota bacterium]
MPEESRNAVVQPHSIRQHHPLDLYFHPRSVAVVGASSRPDGRGNGFLHGLFSQQFPGPIYPVNPKADTILGLRAYPQVLDIPGPLDYVISSIPAAGVPELLRQCAAKGVRLVHLFTAGFGESGYQERADLEGEILRIAREGGVRLLGPNCMGLYCPAGHLAWQRGFPTEPGPVGIVSQSGANADAIVGLGALRGLRFSKVISFGNGLDLNEADWFEYLGDDPETTVVGAYLEGVKDGRRFRQVLERVAHRKPVVILKGGRTEAGGRAAVSHTGSLAGNSQVWDALCRQTGAFRVFGLDELVDTLAAFRYLEPPRGPRVAIMGGGGGFSVLAADDCVAAGLEMPWFSAAVQERLREFVPVAGTSVRNPLDTGSLTRDEAHFTQAVRIITASGEVDCFLVHVGGIGLFSDTDADRTESLARVLVAGARATHLPMALVVRSNVPAYAESTQRLIEQCLAAGLAVFPTVAQAASALIKLRTHRQNGERRQQSDGLYHH